jgi:hypothetical protein
MQSYANTSVSVTATLAKEFALFDRWFSSVPGTLNSPSLLYS